MRERPRSSRTRTLLHGIIAVLLSSPLSAAPALAQSAPPTCGPEGTQGAPAQTPWALRRLDPASAWRLARGGGITVAVIDSGVSATHPLLRGQVLPGRDLGLPDNAGQCDEVGHGTLIAGIIAGKTGTGTPYSGIAPSARILPVRVLRDNQRTFDNELPARIAEAIRWSVDQGATVVNLSLETDPTPELASAVDYALRRNVVLVAAAGNQQEEQQQRNRPAYPGGYPGVIAVAGIDQNGGHVGSSVSGDYVDIAAPGSDIEGPAPRGDGYRVEEGTSFATAYVSGVAALIRAAHPHLSPAEVAHRLTRTADSPPEGRNESVGYGVVNPYRAVASLLGSRGNPSPGAIAPPQPVVDPLARERGIALWAAVIGTGLAIVLLLARPVSRLGRQRGWRPGRAGSAGWVRPAPGPNDAGAPAQRSTPGAASPSAPQTSSSSSSQVLRASSSAP